MFDVDQLIQIGCAPSENPRDWLEGAESAVEYLKRNSQSDATILYARVQQAWICSALAPLAKLDQCALEDLQREHVDVYSTYGIDYVRSDNDDDVRIAKPFDGSDIFEGGEQLVFRRRFDGAERITRTEISQQLIHALGLYWIDHESAFCKLDERGDIKPLLHVIDLKKKTGEDGDILVTIVHEELERYMAATGSGLVMKFDFTRFLSDGSFGGWTGRGEMKYPSETLVYHAGRQRDCSYVNGALIVLPTTTKAQLRQQLQREWSDEDKVYATFIAKDRKTGEVRELSCDPKHLASYFERESELPYEITPAFFNAEVLLRYRSDPEKYDCDERHISCRGGWYLKTYDVNEAGQVHTYLIYLSNLPTNEQLYWKSFNEAPKDDISKRAYETDIRGIFSTQHNPLRDLKGAIAKLDKSPPDWWIPRGDELAKTVHYPVTPSPAEWAEAILLLDQLVVEGFAQKAIRGRLTKAGITFDDNWASLRLLQELAISRGLSESDAINLLDPLRQLHATRSKVKGHAVQSEKLVLINSARNEHGSLAVHFRDLVSKCWTSFAELSKQLKS